MAKFTREDGVTGYLFRESMQSLQENVRTLTQTMTQASLMMGQIMSQVVPCNYHYQPSRYQLSNFGSPISYENRDTVKAMVALLKCERKNTQLVLT